MLISRPFARATQAMLLFLGAVYVLLLVVIYWLLQNTENTLWYYVGIAVLLLIGLPITIRFFYNYKVIEAKKGKINIKKPFLLKEKVLMLNDLEESHEQTIKTFNTEYKLFTARFKNGFLEISNQEYDNYDKLKQYIQKKGKK